MKINNIKTELENDLQYYDCILIDGKWGIGKTYEITKIKKILNKKMAIISLFGKKNIEDLRKEIYHAVRGKFIYILFLIGLFVFASLEVFPIKVNDILPTEILVKLKDGISFYTILYYLMKMISFVITVCFGFIITKENFGNYFLKFKKIKAPQVIVLDDWERVNEQIHIEELLGLIENLKNLGYKIVIIADETKIKQKSEFEKFKEKTIDKVYHIEGCNKDVVEELMFNDIMMNENNKQKILNFIYKNNIENLRTIQKANKFAREMLTKLYVEDQTVALNITMMSIAIVSEINDKIYLNILEDKYNQLLEEKKDTKGQTEIININMQLVNIKERIEDIVKRIVDSYFFYNVNIEQLRNLCEVYLDIQKKENMQKLRNNIRKTKKQESLQRLYNYWPEMEDEEIIENINNVLTKLRKNQYEITEYAKIIMLFVKIKNAGFGEEYFNIAKIVERMKENIRNREDDYEDTEINYNMNFGIYFENQIEECEYKENIEKIKRELQLNKKMKKENEINEIINTGNGWGMRLLEHCSRINFKEETEFLKMLDIEHLVEILKNSKVKDIRDFGRQLNLIYNNENKMRFFENDGESAEQLLNKINEIFETQSSIAQRNSLNIIKIILNEFLENKKSFDIIDKYSIN